MSLANKIFTASLALTLAGCPSTPEKVEYCKQPLILTSTSTESKAVSSTKDTKDNKIRLSEKESYIRCSPTEEIRYEWERYCFGNQEIDSLKELNFDPEEANKLLPLHSVDIKLLQEQGCDLSKYPLLREKLGNDEILRFYNENLVRIVCSTKINVEEIDNIVAAYPSGFKKWEAVILYDAGINGKNAQQYLKLRENFKNIDISVQAMIGFENDINSGKTTYLEVKQLLRKKEIMRNIAK